MKHPIPPVYDERSRVLILGSFPSVKSREVGFFYGHPQNRFWKVIAAVVGDDVPATVEKKKEFLLRHRIALWDVIASCEVEGSADSSIRGAEANDISPILGEAQIRAAFTNGATAHKLYMKHIYPATGVADVCLPSTSPANAAWSVERLTEAWSVVGEAAAEVHRMSLQSAPFEAVAAGTKTVEMRLFDEKRARVAVGDVIEFSHALTGEVVRCRVADVRRYADFAALYAAHDKVSLGYKADEAADAADMERYYSAEDIARYGVVGIVVRVMG